MKNEVNPAAIVGVIAVVVIGLVMFGYRMLQPAPYAASPGSPTASRSTAGGSTYSPGGPQEGGTPGKPASAAR